MLNPEFCKVLCQVSWGKKEVTAFKSLIKEQYHHNWIIDNLPAASIMDTDQYSTTQYVGYPIGYTRGADTFVFNHVNILLEYHSVENEGKRYNN